MRRVVGCLAGALLAFGLAGCTTRVVVRSAGGDLYAGRFISARAYEAYARGALLEAEGRTDAAILSFREAADLDADGPEPWTRLGALLCRQKSDEAGDAFDRAARADATFGPLHREIARCHLARKELPNALRESELAMILDPDDDEAALIHIDALLASGENERAERELVAGALAPAPSQALLNRLAAFGRAAKKPGLERLARCSAGDCRRDAPGAPAGPRDRGETPSLADVDSALEQGDLKRARRVALRAKMNQGTLALRAAALGRFQLAREQASLVALAEPTSIEARIALLASVRPTGDPEAYGAAVDLAGLGSTRPLSRLERLVLAEAVARASGAGAASAVLAGEKLDQSSKDPAEQRVAKRLALRLLEK
jgi:hypothetical protein